MSNRDGILKIDIDANEKSLIRKVIDGMDAVGTEIEKSVSEKLSSAFDKIKKNKKVNFSELLLNFDSELSDTVSQFENVEDRVQAITSLVDILVRKVEKANTINNKNGQYGILNNLDSSQIVEVLGKYDEVIEKENEINKKKQQILDSRKEITSLQEIQKAYKATSEEKEKYASLVKKEFNKNGIADTSGIEDKINEYAEMIALFAKVSANKTKSGTEENVRKYEELIYLMERITSFESSNNISFLSNLRKELASIGDKDNPLKRLFDSTDVLKTSNGLVLAINNLVKSSTKTLQDEITAIENSINTTIQKISAHEAKISGNQNKKIFGGSETKKSEDFTSELSESELELYNKYFNNTKKSAEEMNEEIENIVTELDNLYQKWADNPDGELPAEDRNNFVGYYKRYIELAKELNYETEEAYKNAYNSFLESKKTKKYSDELDRIKSLVEAQKELKNQTEQVDSSSVKNNSGSSVDDSKLHEIEEELSLVKDNVNSLNERINVLESSDSFDVISEQVSELRSNVQLVNDSVGELRNNLNILKNSKVDIKKLVFTAGDLDTLPRLNRKSDSFAQMIEAAIGGFGAFGSGKYYTTDHEDVGDYADAGRKFYAIDISKYDNLLKFNNDEQIQQTLDFLLLVQKKLISDTTEFRGFDDEVKNFDVDELEKTYKDIFEHLGLTKNILKEFISDVKKQFSNLKVDENNNIIGDFRKNDSFTTMLLKKLGYKGVDVSGSEEFDNVYQGSVIFDIDKNDPYVRRFETYEELLSFVNDKLDELDGKKINPIDDDINQTIQNLNQKLEETKQLLDDISERMKYVEGSTGNTPTYDEHEDLRDRVIALEKEAQAAKEAKMAEEKLKKEQQDTSQSSSVLSAFYKNLGVQTENQIPVLSDTKESTTTLSEEGKVGEQAGQQIAESHREAREEIDQTDSAIKTLEKDIENEKKKLESLQKLADGNISFSGKKEATDALRYWYNVLNEQQNEDGKYNHKTVVSYNNVLKAAQELGVAQSSINQYFNAQAVGEYDKALSLLKTNIEGSTSAIKYYESELEKVIQTQSNTNQIPLLTDEHQTSSSATEFNNKNYEDLSSIIKQLSSDVQELKNKFVFLDDEVSNNSISENIRQNYELLSEEINILSVLQESYKELTALKENLSKGEHSEYFSSLISDISLISSSILELNQQFLNSKQNINILSSESKNLDRLLLSLKEIVKEIGKKNSAFIAEKKIVHNSATEEIKDFKSLYEIIKRIYTLTSNLGSDVKHIPNELSPINEYISSLKKLYEQLDFISKNPIKFLFDLPNISQYSNLIAQSFSKYTPSFNLNNGKLTTNTSDVDILNELTNLFREISNGHYYNNYNDKPVSDAFYDIFHGYATVSDNVINILKTLKLSDEHGNTSTDLITGGATNKGGFVGDEFAVIARPNRYLERVKQLKDLTSEAASYGANIANTIGIINDENNNWFYDVQKAVKGKGLQETSEWLDATDKQIQKLIEDIYIINKSGLHIDLAGDNILYDSKTGFSFVDLGDKPFKNTHANGHFGQDNPENAMDSVMMYLRRTAKDLGEFEKYRNNIRGIFTDKVSGFDFDKELVKINDKATSVIDNNSNQLNILDTTKMLSDLNIIEQKLNEITSKKYTITIGYNNIGLNPIDTDENANPIIIYRGTHDASGNNVAYGSKVYDNSAYYSTSHKVSTGYGKDKIYASMVKAGANVLTIDAKGSSWTHVTHDGITQDTDEWLKYAKNQGYDLLKIKNVVDTNGIGGVADDYIVLNKDILVGLHAVDDVLTELDGVFKESLKAIGYSTEQINKMSLGVDSVGTNKKEIEQKIAKKTSNIDKLSHPDRSRLSTSIKSNDLNELDFDFDDEFILIDDDDEREFIDNVSNSIIGTVFEWSMKFTSDAMLEIGKKLAKYDLQLVDLMDPYTGEIIGEQIVHKSYNKQTKETFFSDLDGVINPYEYFYKKFEYFSQYTPDSLNKSVDFVNRMDEDAMQNIIDHIGYDQFLNNVMEQSKDIGAFQLHDFIKAAKTIPFGDPFEGLESFDRWGKDLNKHIINKERQGNEFVSKIFSQLQDNEIEKYNSEIEKYVDYIKKDLMSVDNAIVEFFIKDYKKIDDIKDRPSIESNNSINEENNNIEQEIEEFAREEQAIYDLITVKEKLAEVRKEDANLPSVSNKNIERLLESEVEVIEANKNLSDSAKETYQWVENEGNSAQSSADQMIELYNAKARAVEANLKLRESAEDTADYLALEGEVAEKSSKKVDENAKAIQSYFGILNSGNEKYNKYLSLFEYAKNDGRNIPSGYENQLNALNENIEKLQALKDKVSNKESISDEDIKNAVEYNNEIKKIISSFQDNEFKFVNDLQISKLDKELSEFAHDNKKASKEVDVLRQRLKSVGSIEELNKLRSDFFKLKTTINDTGKTGKTFVQQIREQINHLWAKGFAQIFGFYDIIRYIKQAFTTIRELDTALVDLRKTTAMTSSELKEFYYASNDIAKRMGVTTAEIINQASAFSRLGYSSKEAATQMAELSSQFASISPDMDVNTATDGLVSIMKAFDVQVGDVERKILDNVNIIGNTAATSNGEIVDMLQRSSAAMKEANNSLEETIALETAAIEITRNAETTGTAFKTISMRIRGKSLPPYTVMYMLCA